jgi:hypothetical protein
MSRSYKKFPGYTDHHTPHSRWAKRQASKAVRRTFDLSDGRSYKKVYPSYDICDYKFIWWSKKEVEEWYDGYALYKGIDPVVLVKRAYSK